jgi:hypothetical protein
MTAPTADASSKKTPRSGRTLKLQSVAPSDSPDMIIAEVAAFRRERESTVWRKIRSGAYVSFKSGDKRLVTRESVLADRERCLAQGPRLTDPPDRAQTPRQANEDRGRGPCRFRARRRRIFFSTMPTVGLATEEYTHVHAVRFAQEHQG